MSLRFDEYPDSELVYLSRADVLACAKAIDPIETVEATLRQHAVGETLLPSEAYMGWHTRSGASARSLAMPGGIRGEDGAALGVKIINGSMANPAQGLARAQGLLILFDQDRAWPTVLMEAAYISSLRTAGVTAVAAAHLAAPGVDTLAVLGCGTLAKAHLLLLSQSMPDVTQVRLFDIDPARSAALAAEITADPALSRWRVQAATDPASCVRDAGLVVAVTTVTEGYLAYDWLTPGALVAHVSLDDVLPEVVERADLVLVDDWELVRDDQHRLLGRMYRAGQLRGPGGETYADTGTGPPPRQVDGTLGDVLIGNLPGRRGKEDVILCNPFGMAIMDIAIGAQIAAVAREQRIGRTVPV